jgi:hypothetical protein
MNKTSIFLGIANEIADIMQKRMPYLTHETVESVAADLGNWIVERTANTAEQNGHIVQQPQA